jgi:hypothetical protein
LTHVKPERDQNNRASRRKNWWLFGEPVGKLRSALAGLRRYIATLETSKFKPFVFIEGPVIPDHKLYAIASDDALVLGILNSRVHNVWALSAGGYLGVGNDPTWTNTTTFLPFPFPVCGEPERSLVRDIAERLDAHRRRVQAERLEVTLTGMYNVLEKLRSGEALNEKERRIHDAGLVSVLRQLHDDLDAAVFAAYGWPVSLTDAEILDRLVALNGERAKEEASGLVRWLRPDYQNPGGAQGQQGALAVEEAADGKSGKSGKKMGKLAWPKTMAERVMAVSGALAGVKEAVTAADVAGGFSRAKAADVGEILETLCAMGRAHKGKVAGTFLP